MNYHNKCTFTLPGHKQAVFLSHQGLCSKVSFHTFPKALVQYHHIQADILHSLSPYPYHSKCYTIKKDNCMWNLRIPIKNTWIEMQLYSWAQSTSKSIYYLLKWDASLSDLSNFFLSLMVAVSSRYAQYVVCSALTFMAWYKKTLCMASRTASMPRKENEKLDTPPLTLAPGKFSCTEMFTSEVNIYKVILEG